MRYDDDAADVRGYTTAPGILLIITGIVYLLVGLALLVIGLVWTGITNTPEFQREYRKEFSKEINKNPRMTPEQRREAEAVGKGIEQGMYVSGPTMLGWGLLSLPSGILVLVGGITMMRMRAYALS